jgi:Putative peptidoglycan binding domain
MRQTMLLRVGSMMVASLFLVGMLAVGAFAEEGSKPRSKVGPSSHVRELQQALQQSGHDPGPIDGIMGPRTKAALRKYIAVPPPQPPSPADQVIARFRTERREAP